MAVELVQMGSWACWKRRAGKVGVVGATALLLALSIPSGAEADGGAELTPAAGDLTGFDLTATAGVLDFTISYPNLFAYRVAGGLLESVSFASGSGNSSGLAGPMPLPLAANAGSVYPTNIPTTSIEAPAEGRAAWTSIDWASMPNQCKSEYPDLYDQGREDRSCGGPAQEDAKLGYTAGLANGHSRSTGERNDPLKAANESVSRGVDVTVPALQMKIHDGWAQTKTGINPEGVPESRATVDIDSVAILTGLIQLKGIHSEGIAISDGTDAGSKFTSTFSLREAFVAGVPVVIGRDGVSVRSDALLPGKNVQDAAKEVSESLKAADVQLRLIPAPATSKQAGHASSQAQGVEIVHQGATLTPSNSSYRFGFVSASAGATRSTGESGSSDAATAGDPSGPAGSTGTGSASGPASTDSQPGTVPTWSGTSDSTSNPAMGGTSTSIATPDDGPASAVSGWSSDPDVSPTATSASASAGTTLSSVPGVPPGPAQGAGTEALGTLPVQPGPVLGAVRASHEVLPAKKVKNMVGVMLLLGVLGALSAPLRKLLVTR